MQKWSCFELTEVDVNNYADSLNFWKAGEPFPNFILDPKFDQRFTYSNVCLRTNWIFSHRKLIIDRVANIVALEAIIKSKNPLLDSVYVLSPTQIEKEEDYIEDFPYATHSTRYLVQRRLDKINLRKRLLEKSKK
jgi:hypothetical protein